MVTRNTTHGQFLALADDLHGPFHLVTVGKHLFPTSRADVVQVNVDRQARQVEAEEVEGGAAFQCEASTKRRMPLEHGQ